MEEDLLPVHLYKLLIDQHTAFSFTCAHTSRGAGHFDGDLEEVHLIIVAELDVEARLSHDNLDRLLRLATAANLHVQG